MKRLLLAALAVVLTAAAPIDRQALVTRHNPVLTKIDPHSPLMVGNGEIGFTADITGLQTFPEQYSNLAPLLTMAQWAWHSFPNPKGYSEKDGLTSVSVPGRGEQGYPWIRSWDEANARPAINWLRENPHRISLGRIALAMTDRVGRPAKFTDLSATRQRLDMWTGALVSEFIFDGEKVTVETRVHPTRDMLLVSVASPLVARGRLAIEVRYPGVAAKINPDPSDFSDDAAHKTVVTARGAGRLSLRRQIDDTVYFSTIAAPGSAVAEAGPHQFRISGKGPNLVALVSFDRAAAAPASDYPSAVAAVTKHWRDYWSRGGVIDFSGTRDRRAAELERRIVLSQYLQALNGAGSLPPQEEGLFSNSWNGKFHLEMHPWHSAHFASWGRPALLERSMGWYADHLPEAKKAAASHKVEGAWWPKMVGPEGRNSPSTVNPFIMWQQPHPIYLAELSYRAHPDAATLKRYGAVVEETAKLLATWPTWDAKAGRYVLGPPVIPVQENHPPLTTVNPAFELEYFRWGLQVAQAWRERQGLRRDAQWDRVIAKLAPVAERDGLYLPVETAPDFWRDAASPRCKGRAVEAACMNRDHPSFLMAYGLIGGDRIKRETMRRTLAATERDWDMRQTWGWDFPMIAMTAARLGDPNKAVDWLLRDLPNNQWSVAGMTPRGHVAESGIGPAGHGGGGEGYQRVAETYFPSNGSLLLAAGMMAAGWDGSQGPAPGFPKDWTVRTEGIRPIP